MYRKLSANRESEIREKALVLSVLFDDPQALADLRSVIANQKAEAVWRQFALQTLVDKRPADLSAVLNVAVDDPVLRRV